MVNLQRDEVKKRGIGVCIRIYIHKLINTGIWLLFGKETYIYLFKQLRTHEVFVASIIDMVVADRLLDNLFNLKDALWTGEELFVLLASISNLYYSLTASFKCFFTFIQFQGSLPFMCRVPSDHGSPQLPARYDSFDTLPSLFSAVTNFHTLIRLIARCILYHHSPPVRPLSVKFSKLSFLILVISAVFCWF